MRFGPWHRLEDAAGAAPRGPGVLQVRRADGLAVYPRGKSAMILYAGADDLQAACRRLAGEHPGADWLCRFNRDPVEGAHAAAARLVADFEARFGAPPAATLANPEAVWERSVARPAVDRAFVDARLARWPWLCGRPFAVLAGGLRSLNLRIGEVVARVAVESPPRLRREAALLRAVGDRVRVPRVIDGDDEVLLLEYVDHAELPATAEAGARVGEAAARIHAPQAGAGGFGDDGALGEPSASALAELRAWVSPALEGRAGARLGAQAAAIAALWAREAAAMAAAERDCVRLHGDFKPANVKWLPGAGEVVVFDWEFAWAGPALCDVGQMLRWDPPEAFVAGFADGYRAGGGRLPDGWRRLAACFDLFNLVSFLDAPEPRPRREAAVLDRVARTLAAAGV